MSTKTWIIFAAVVVALFGGLIYLSTRDSTDVSDVNPAVVLGADKRAGDLADHTFGNTKSKVVLVEYGDYQCPGCASASEPLKTVSEKYKDHMVFVFRNYPLVSLHPNARAAAAAAEAAGLLGKFWEMHDLLYANQSSWERATTSERNSIFEGYASQIGLDVTKFANTLREKSDVINKKISFDQALGSKVGVTGTPAFYLNGKSLDQYVLDGKIVPANTSGATAVWTDADLLDKYVLQPAFKEAGIDVSATNKDASKK